MKNLVYAAAFTLVIASFVPVAGASGKSGDAKFSHLLDSVAYPANGRAQNATHQIKVHVQGKALSELLIDLPEEVNITDGIEVKNQLGKTIPTTVSIKDRRATVVFYKPIAPETILSIALRGVETPGYDNNWLYGIYVKKVGLNAEIPLSIAQITTYSD